MNQFPAVVAMLQSLKKKKKMNKKTYSKIAEKEKQTGIMADPKENITKGKEKNMTQEILERLPEYDTLERRLLWKD